MLFRSSSGGQAVLSLLRAQVQPLEIKIPQAVQPRGGGGERGGEEGSGETQRAAVGAQRSLLCPPPGPSCQGRGPRPGRAHLLPPSWPSLPGERPPRPGSVPTCSLPPGPSSQGRPPPQGQAARPPAPFLPALPVRGDTPEAGLHAHLLLFSQPFRSRKTPPEAGPRAHLLKIGRAHV